MPKLQSKRSHSHKIHVKRRGHHQKHTKDFLKTYWPYMPTLLMLLFGLSIGFGWQPQPSQLASTGPRGGVLAYATNINASGLLSETNARRTSNSKNALALNSKLNQAAQAKANDMATRDYWSHNTPEGNPPWIFIDQTGYAYQKAGENLAYGFATSTETVTGWMNSPTHKDNMLDGNFLEVGFGMANSQSYQGNGQQTIVVALYAKPTVVAAAAAPTSPPPTPPTTQTTPSTQTTPATPNPAQSATEATEPSSASVTETPSADNQDTIAVAIPSTNTTDSSRLDTPTTSVARIQLLTGGAMPWTSFGLSLLTGVLIVVIGLRHVVALKRVIRQGERFLLGHPLLDFAIVTLFSISMYLNVPIGLIR